MDYYQIARHASQSISDHPGLIYLHSLCKNASSILDVGCGEGSRLATLLSDMPKPKKVVGVDPSSKALSLARNRYPHFSFSAGVGEKLPFSANSFDLVYSAFAIEHCADPGKFVSEMVRVCKKSGHIVILAPNYGAPNRRSPPSLESPLNKLAEGLIKDFFPRSGLVWDQVTPKPDYHQIDDDTTYEPYTLSLTRFLVSRGLVITSASSLWELEPPARRFHHLLFRILGHNLHLFPFTNWGPQLFVAAQK